MKLFFFGASLIGALLAGVSVSHCSSSAAIPVENSGAGQDATLTDGNGTTKKPPPSDIGKACTSPSDCANSETEACCIVPPSGTKKGLCALRTQCGPDGTGGVAVGTVGAGGKGYVGSGAQLCGVSAPCAPGSVCVAETCEAPDVQVCSGSSFCSGGSCTLNSECASGMCVNGKCAAGTCKSNCPPGDACSSGSQCASGMCVNGTCAAGCTSDCPEGDPCTSGSECASGTCTDGKCGALCQQNCPAGSGCTSDATCSSGVCLNGKCDGNCMSNCPGGDLCTSGAECQSGVCTAGVCVGPACSPSCPDGQPCTGGSDCESGVCTDGVCASPPCAPFCGIGSVCGGNFDCKSGICIEGSCRSTCTPDCTQGQPCGANDDCYSFICMNGICVPPLCSPMCATTQQCGGPNTDCVKPDTCVMGKCTAPTITCGSCKNVTNTVGSFTCVELSDPCGTKFNCSCLEANEPCAACPVSCNPGAKDQCEMALDFDAGGHDASGAGGAGSMECCSLGPNAGGFCSQVLSNEMDGGLKNDAGLDAALKLDAAKIKTSCPATCDPCGSNSCPSKSMCCPIIRGNKQAGACVPSEVDGSTVPCPLPQCNPLTCAQQGYNCGQWTDGCTHALDCGDTCPNTADGGRPQTCGASGRPGWCAPAPPDGGYPPYDAGVDGGFCKWPPWP